MVHTVVDLQPIFWRYQNFSWITLLTIFFVQKMLKLVL